MFDCVVLLCVTYSVLTIYISIPFTERGMKSVRECVNLCIITYIYNRRERKKSSEVVAHAHAIFSGILFFLTRNFPEMPTQIIKNM